MQGVIYQYLLNGKYYVGKTYMLERKRISKHKYEAFTLKKEHPFCKAIRKYGWETTLAGYSVIERHEADTVEELNRILIEREAYWIKQRNAIVPNGYNIYQNGQITPPHTYNKEEIYARVSKSLKGKYMNNPDVSKRVYCFEQDKWYPSIREAERQNNIAKGSIGKVLSGANVRSGGLTWGFSETPMNRVDQIKAARKQILCVETGEVFESVYAAAKLIFGENDASKKKCRIQASLRNGWAVCGRHYKFVEQDNPVLSEKEV